MATHILRPNADSKAAWTEDPVGNAFDVLDDNVTYLDTPTTGSDRITTTGSGQQCVMGFTTFTIGNQTVSTVTLWVYGKAVDSSNYYDFTITTPSGSTITTSTPYTSSSFGWHSVTYRGSLTQADLDGIGTTINSTGATGTREIDAVYMEVVTKPTTLRRLGGRRRHFQHG